MRTPPVLTSLTMCVRILVGAGGVVAADAADTADATPPPPAQTPANENGWSHSGRIGAFYTNVSTQSSTTSRDGTIAGARRSSAYVLSFDSTLLWRSDWRSTDENLRLRYGRVQIQGQPWQKNSDEIHYDGVFRGEFHHPHFIYGAWGADSVFINTIDRKPLDPITAKVSVGYGQRYHGLLLESDDPHQPDLGRDRLEMRVGVRAQKRWSRHDQPVQDRIETGPEGFIRYDRPIHPVLRWFMQYEVFAEFRDLEHVTQVVTAGLSAALSPYVTAEIAFRAYRESTPDYIANGSGYDAWGSREDTLIGVTYAF